MDCDSDDDIVWVGDSYEDLQPSKRLKTEDMFTITSQPGRHSDELSILPGCPSRTTAADGEISDMSLSFMSSVEEDVSVVDCSTSK